MGTEDAMRKGGRWTMGMPACDSACSAGSAGSIYKSWAFRANIGCGPKEGRRIQTLTRRPTPLLPCGPAVHRGADEMVSKLCALFSDVETPETGAFAAEALEADTVKATSSGEAASTVAPTDDSESVGLRALFGDDGVAPAPDGTRTAGSLHAAEEASREGLLGRTAATKDGEQEESAREGDAEGRRGREVPGTKRSGLPLGRLASPPFGPLLQHPHRQQAAGRRRLPGAAATITTGVTIMARMRCVCSLAMNRAKRRPVCRGAPCVRCG